MEEAFMEDLESHTHDKNALLRPLSISQLIAMCLACMVEASHMTICYTIAVYMVYSFLTDQADETRIGTLTGLLSSLYSMAQLVLAFMWGIVSDRCGRKPLIIMSNFFSTISMLMFGLSGNYTAAALARIIGGAFNSSFTNVKCMLAESTDFSSQTVAMGYLGTAYGFGAILGPVIGGALAFPCDALGPGVPWCGEGQLNAVRPFFLPCFLAALVSLIALVSNTFMLTETLPKIVAAKAARLQATQKDEQAPLLAGESHLSSASEVNGGAAENGGQAAERLPQPHGLQTRRSSAMATRSSMWSSSDDVILLHSRSSTSDVKPWLQAGTSRLLTSEVSATVADDIVDLQQQGFSVSDALLSPRPSRFGKLLNRLVSDAAISSLEAADLDSAALKPRWSTGSHGQHTARQFGLPHSPLLSHNPPVASVFAQDEHQNAGPDHHHLDRIVEGQSTGAEPPTQAAKADDATASPEREVQWYKIPELVLAIAGTTGVVFLSNMLDEITPIFAATPLDHGGLELTSSELSVPLGISGAALMLWSLLAFPRIIRCLGARATALLGLSVLTIVSLVLGSISFLAGAQVSHGAILVVLVVVECVKACFQQLCFPTSMAMVNRYCPASKRGEVNGTSQSLASLVRAVGPFFGGLLWGVFSGLALPGAQLIPFAIISAITLGTALIYTFMPTI